MEWVNYTQLTNLQKLITGSNTTDFNATSYGIIEIIYADLNTTATGDVYTVLDDVTVDEGKPKWRRILDIIQIILLTWGITTNLLSALCFRKHPAGFSRQIQLLFEHQCWIDFSTCLIGFLTVVSPAYWSVGAYYFDYIMCYLWHGQILYWVVAANSYYGLVLLAIDRYLAVVKPIMYKTITISKILIVMVIIYLLNISFVWPLGFLVKMEGDKCVAGYTVKGNAGVMFGKAHAVIMTLYEYVLPCVWFVGLYGQVIYTLKKKKEVSAVEGSSTVEKASAQIIKAATAVTGLFMFTIGWAYGYYVFGVLEIGWTFQMNSPWQQIDVLMSSINSSANPLLYYILMPRFRLVIIKTFFRPCARKIKPHESTRKTDTSETGTG